MANRITEMSKIIKAIKFYCNGISKHLSLSRNTVKKYISLSEVLGLSFEVISDKTDAELELLFSHTTMESISPKLQILHDFFPKMERGLKSWRYHTPYWGATYYPKSYWLKELIIWTSLQNME